MTSREVRRGDGAPTATQWLLSSHDRGRTWSLTGFEEPESAPAPFLISWDAAYSVHPDGDSLIQIPTAAGDAWVPRGFYSFDPATAEVHEHPVLGQTVLDHSVRATGPLISGWAETFYGTDRWFNAFHYDTRDQSFHEETAGEPLGASVPGGPLPSAVTTATADGRLCWSFYIDGFEFGCVGWARPAEFAEPQRGPCIDRDVLPRQLRDHTGLHAFRTGAVGVVSRWGDHALSCLSGGHEIRYDCALRGAGAGRVAGRPGLARDPLRRRGVAVGGLRETVPGLQRARWHLRLCRRRRLVPARRVNCTGSCGVCYCVEPGAVALLKALVQAL